MKNKIAKIFLLNFLILFFSASNSFAVQGRNITIFAEPNMVLALTKIARLYSQKSNVIVSVNFNSSDLSASIDSGEPADVFISAHPEAIELLRQKGWVDVYNTSYIASDELVLITAKTNPTLPKELADKKLSFEESLKVLNQNKATLILDAEGLTSGKFSNDFIQNSQLLDLKLFNKLAEDKSPIMSIIRSSNENYALLLASQLKHEPDFQILATKKNESIFYQALVIAGDNMEVAREFLKFLKTPAAKEILKQSGFIVN